ncbi:hypothetical protein WMY93_029160 [Mugilogobius chulae]|uniref:C1q domain-containing protein n=1 Tax=Mugilogobius chulae TaxID=88201 RepID=A0AAW0N281_9GOBI
MQTVLALVLFGAVFGLVQSGSEDQDQTSVLMGLQTKIQNLETALAQQQNPPRVAFCAGLYTNSEEGNYGPFNSLTTMVFKNVLTNDGNGYNPATGTTLPQVRPATGTTLPQVRPCHRYNPATGTTLSQVRLCHRYNPVTCTTLSQVRPCHRYDPATGTTLPQVRPCHMYDPVTGTTLPQVRPVTGTTCHRSLPGFSQRHVLLPHQAVFHLQPNSNLGASLKKNAQILGYMLDQASGDTHDSSSLSVVVPLEVGDSVFVELGAESLCTNITEATTTSAASSSTPCELQRTEKKAGYTLENSPRV